MQSLPACRLAVGQEKVDPLSPEAAIVKRGDLLDGAKQLGTGVFGQIRQGRSMIVGHDEDVTYVEGLDFHERGATGVAHHDARRQPASEYPCSPL